MGTSFSRSNEEFYNNDTASSSHMNEPLVSPLFESTDADVRSRKYDKKVGVEIQLEDFAISIEPKSSPFASFWSGGEDGNAIEKKQVFIVHPFSTLIPGASLFGILGGSGSGKTTLLNILAGRFDKGSYKVHGSTSFSAPGCLVGYVTQADFLLPHLTVRETLTFTAKLKISPENLAALLLHSGQKGLRKEDISYDRLVETVIMDLGLKECADSRIGVDALVDGKRGLSGGEKRRVSVGLQILTDPEGSILCLSVLLPHSLFFLSFSALC
jgi:ABC-type nitrate/sulfonate/bicarbonate transport system ATPase subunit